MGECDGEGKVLAYAIARGVTNPIHPVILRVMQWDVPLIRAFVTTTLPQRKTMCLRTVNLTQINE